MNHADGRRRVVDRIGAGRLPERTIETAPQRELKELFGENVFSLSVMRATLPKDVCKKLLRTIQEGEPLDPSVADVVANAMKDWAVGRGATHYCHWFQPLTGQTAEKHDAFLVPTGDGRAISEFSGKMLIMGEPDASSFPSGGVRSTFEARGYTAWDPTSPAFLMEGVNGKTLCVPTAFCSFDGTALDQKTPLLRSLAALNQQALRILKLFGRGDVRMVSGTVGPEQEYFLIDRGFYFLRPDLINAGRTLFGARPPKGQELEDHYFGTIKERVLAFMMECERELYRLGVPVKTRHNEVSPAQFEIAPVFEAANIGVDHNMLLMEVLRNTALKHGLKCLFHEKPFSGVNGSGKHVNWSMADNLGNNLLDPGHTPHENAQFLVFLTSVIRAIHKYGKLMRAAVATPGNDHRLGANEAPPAIISAYLGDKLTEVVNGLIAGKSEPGRSGGMLKIGVSTLPPLPRDDSDRNRTSPFAFTGAKFEFRAVGAGQSIAGPLIVLNTIVTESLDYMATQLEAAASQGTELGAAIQKLVQQELKAHQAVLFNGDNYSVEWQQEAERRGLPNLRSSVDAIPKLLDPDARDLFPKYGVYSQRELEARTNILLESYAKTINVEAQLTSQMAATLVLPAATAAQRELAQTIAGTRDVLGKAPLGGLEETLGRLSEKVNALVGALGKLDACRARMEHHGDLLQHARYQRDEVVPAMAAVRTVADELENLVDDARWPLPKYREMLFMF
jgi:glutamine synthetase